MIRLPDPVCRRLERLVAGQRRLRRLENERAVAAQDTALRAWADRARAAHQAARCLDGCPFAHGVTP